jgi:hypothetical protein
MSTTEIPAEWEDREVIKASESPYLAKQKEERLATRKRNLVRDVKRGILPESALDDFNAELQREGERVTRRQNREDEIDLAKERILNAQREEDIRRAAEAQLEAEETS